MTETPHTPAPIATQLVPGIAPVDGWRLFQFDEWDGYGFCTTGYTARRGAEERLLPVSRFRFTPSQARFAFLVAIGFAPSPGPVVTSWDDTEIEDALALAKRVAA